MQNTVMKEIGAVKEKSHNIYEKIELIELDYDGPSRETNAKNAFFPAKMKETEAKAASCCA